MPQLLRLLEQSMGTKNRQVILRQRPKGRVCDEDFQLIEAEVFAPEAGQLLIRNLYLSLDPAIRGWMNDVQSYMPPISLGSPIRSGSIGEVVESKSDRFKPGQWVTGLMAWEDYSVVSHDQVYQIIPKDTPVPLPCWNSVLGSNGLAAYFGLLDVGAPQPGETVLVSSAAGGVGSVVGPLAKLKGCTTIGLTGSDEKCDWLLKEVGYDVAINYKTENLAKALKAACPQGVNVFFDNVGGEILNIALTRLAVGARVVLCGAISQINATERAPGPSNYLRLLSQRARMEGFVSIDYAHRFKEARERLLEWLTQGNLAYRHHIVEGLENTPGAFNCLFNGQNRGKLMVKVAAE